MSYDNLYTPTYITKIEDKYYIVDCWHHRILCSDNIYKKIKKWIKYADVLGGHTIVTNNTGIIAYDDTDNDKVIFKNTFYNIIEEIELDKYLPQNYQYINEHKLIRPHFIHYDEEEDIFLIALSWGGGFAVVDCKEEIRVKSLIISKQFENSYIKFISKFEGLFWATTDKEFVGFEIKESDIKIKKRYAIPFEFSKKINYICKIEDIYLISAWQIGGIYILRNLENLEKYTLWEDINDSFHMKGIPYYISQFDNKLWITEIGSWQGIYSFQVSNGEVKDVNCIFSNDIDSFDVDIKNIDRVLS